MPLLSTVLMWGPPEWSALAAGITAAVAVVAATFAFFQVREARHLRNDQAKPFVVVDIQPSRVVPNVLNLVVENIGNTIATNVRFQFDPPLGSTMDGYDIADTEFVKSGYPMIPPRRRHEYLFDMTVDRHASNLPMKFDVLVTYMDQNGAQQDPMRFVIDLSPLYGIHYVAEKGVHHIAKSLDQIAKQTKSWTRHQNGIRVYARSEDAERRQDAAQEALTGSYPYLGSQRPPEILMWIMQLTPLRVAVGALVARLRAKRDVD